MCGSQNPWSLGLCFKPDDTGKVCAHFQAREVFQGYDGILHGGVISGLLDAAMTHCLFHQGVHALTAELHVRFLEPIPCSALLEVRAWPLPGRPPLFIAAAEVLQGDRIMASGTAKFMRCPRYPA
jgi:acyl-coenzyme A thioesterase PaaI-like protein